MFREQRISRMKRQLKEIAGNTFYQLMIVYTICVLLIALGFLSKYTLQFHIFAVMLGILGVSIIPEETSKVKINRKVHYIFFLGAVLIIFAFRSIPYLGNSVPLGYDPGLYKYGIEYGLINLDSWILSGGMEPGFLYLMIPFKFLFSSQFILTWLFIFFSLLLGLSIYFFTREFLGEQSALFSLLIFSLSVIQFKTFWYLYYKNVIGLSFMLFSMYFLAKYEKSEKRLFLGLFIVLGGLVLSVHRPTFYIFGISYFLYALISPYRKGNYNFNKLKINILSGILIGLIGMSFYAGKFLPAITNILPFVAEGFISPGESPGTFISFFYYQYSALLYLPFAIIGLFYFLKKKEFNMIVIWAIINLSIVYFQFFFFNRFIIHLDIVLIILSGQGLSILFEDKRKLFIMLSLALMLSGLFFISNESTASKPLLSEKALSFIERIPELTEENSKIMVISSEYSPWVKGYSGRTTIAPGLFDENKWGEEEWEIFWTATDMQKTREMMSVYEKPIYLYAGTKSFNNPCFSLYIENNGEKIYKYDC